MTNLKKTNVVIDSSWKEFGGIGRFTEEISKRLILSRELLFSRTPASPIATLHNMFSSYLNTKSNEILFFTGYIPPLSCNNKYIVTLHDLNHLDIESNATLLKTIFYNTVIKSGCKRAYRVFTVSEFSKNRIIEWAKLKEDMVINIGNGVDEKFSPDVDAYNPGYKYILCVSNRKAHKNETRLIEAFSKASFDEDVKLAFSGNPNSELQHLIDELGVQEKVTFLGYVQEDELPSVYKGAVALAFPSLYEGFGLPVVEAMACGTPVLTSNVTSLPEVAGDAAYLVDPYSIDEIKDGLEVVVNDSSFREQAIEKGLRQASKFTWEAVVDRIQGQIEKLSG
ncbi:glycosyltransferase family 1 protein [Vibrio albus]|uniref:Glycosyltransferase family 1 protein n=1 Tax=Vibrio albus TaxID=2200953 RepID=A0A2U3BCP0_9VIBR|nr:glycosyltransferase family 1 protein [Vibrio albus]PWI34552.1 glycosyltransferase family 1 protein [Vibrio albus]